MEVLVTLPEDLYKYFEYIPVEYLSSVVLDLMRDALERKLESGLEGESKSSSNEMLQNLLSQISTMTGTSESSNIMQRKNNTPFEVNNIKKENVDKPTEVKYISPIECDDDDEDLDDFFK